MLAEFTLNAVENRKRWLFIGIEARISYNWNANRTTHGLSSTFNWLEDMVQLLIGFLYSTLYLKYTLLFRAHFIVHKFAAHMFNIIRKFLWLCRCGTFLDLAWNRQWLNSAEFSLCMWFFFFWKQSVPD